MKRGLFFLLLVAYSSAGPALAENSFQFSGSVGPIPKTVAKKMKKYSWREGCPVPMEELSYLRLSHWGLDGKIHTGELIVNREVATETLQIFEELFRQKFPVEKMELVDKYNGSDDLSMAANNTSAFNCRSVTDKPGVFSRHSYGKAIDINTKINPYVRGEIVEPKGGEAFLDRREAKPGMIIANDAVVQTFIRRGWEWGGSWKTLKDYQHFEKR